MTKLGVLTLSFPDFTDVSIVLQGSDFYGTLPLPETYEIGSWVVE
jgi:hypothetical protein